MLAQSSEIPSATDCYFIKNGLVVIKPGQNPSKSSIVIRNGLITEVGANITPPYDAKIINVDSMYVYPGFIDPLSHTGLKEPEKEDKSKEDKPKSPGVATFTQAGITPQVLASQMINCKDKSINSMMESGFGISHTVPKGYILPGQGSIISLKESNSNENLILRKDISMVGELKTKRGVFPSTLIGAMSRLREINKNTDIYLKNIAAYKANPVGMERPAHVSEYEAFGGVTNKSKPLFFVADKPKEIHRAVTLQKDLGFDIILSDVKLITPLIDIIKPNTPILLSLKLPKEIKDEDKVDSKDSLDTKKKVQTEEYIRLTAKKKESYDLYLSQAKILAEKNILFSFSYMDISTSDILKSIRRLIAAGLPENNALEALTTSPAKILNISAIAGTIEKGKLGNLVITDKPLFDEKSKIKYVIVEGQVTELKKSDSSKTNKNDDKKVGDLSGTWRYEVEVEGGTQYGNMFFEKDGSSYTIGVESDETPSEVDQGYDISVDRSNISFKLDIENEGIKMTVKLDLNFTSNTNFEGTAEIEGMGSFKISGVRRLIPD